MKRYLRGVIPYILSLSISVSSLSTSFAGPEKANPKYEPPFPPVTWAFVMALIAIFNPRKISEELSGTKSLQEQKFQDFYDALETINTVYSVDAKQVSDAAGPLIENLDEFVKKIDPLRYGTLPFATVEQGFKNMLSMNAAHQIPQALRVNLRNVPAALFANAQTHRQAQFFGLRVLDKVGRTAQGIATEDMTIPGRIVESLLQAVAKYVTTVPGASLVSGFLAEKLETVDQEIKSKNIPVPNAAQKGKVAAQPVLPAHQTSAAKSIESAAQAARLSNTMLEKLNHFGEDEEQVLEVVRLLLKADLKAATAFLETVERRYSSVVEEEFRLLPNRIENMPQFRDLAAGDLEFKEILMIVSAMPMDAMSSATLKNLVWELVNNPTIGDGYDAAYRTLKLILMRSVDPLLADVFQKMSARSSTTGFIKDLSNSLQDNGLAERVEVIEQIIRSDVNQYHELIAVDESGHLKIDPQAIGTGKGFQVHKVKLKTGETYVARVLKPGAVEKLKAGHKNLIKNAPRLAKLLKYKDEYGQTRVMSEIKFREYIDQKYHEILNELTNIPATVTNARLAKKHLEFSVEATVEGEDRAVFQLVVPEVKDAKKGSKVMLMRALDIDKTVATDHPGVTKFMAGMLHNQHIKGLLMTPLQASRNPEATEEEKVGWGHGDLHRGNTPSLAIRSREDGLLIYSQAVLDLGTCVDVPIYLSRRIALLILAANLQEPELIVDALWELRDQKSGKERGFNTTGTDSLFLQAVEPASYYHDIHILRKKVYRALETSRAAGTILSPADYVTLMWATGTLAFPSKILHLEASIRAELSNLVDSGLTVEERKQVDANDRKQHSDLLAEIVLSREGKVLRLGSWISIAFKRASSTLTFWKVTKAAWDVGTLPVRVPGRALKKVTKPLWKPIADACANSFKSGWGEHE